MAGTKIRVMKECVFVSKDGRTEKVTLSNEARELIEAEDQKVSNPEIEKSWIDVLKAAKSHHEALLGAKLIGRTRLSVEARNEAVIMLRDKGLSEREIATSINEPKSTVHRLLRPPQMGQETPQMGQLIDEPDAAAIEAKKVWDFMRSSVRWLPHIDTGLAIKEIKPEKIARLIEMTVKLEKWCRTLCAQLEKENVL